MDNSTVTVTIYEPWVRIAKRLKDADKGRFYDAILRYSLYGEEPQLSDPCDNYFELIRPFIDKSNARKIAGAKGGKANGKQNPKQNESKPEANPEANGKQNESNEKEKVKEKEKEKENTLSACAPVCAYAAEAEKIARAYPPAKVGNWRELVEAVTRAVAREVEDHPGMTVEDALHRVEDGTIAYADAVSKWKNKRYISDGVKFYDSGMYNHDPDTWKEAEDDKKFDVMNPETW